MYHVSINNHIPLSQSTRRYIICMCWPGIPDIPNMQNAFAPKCHHQVPISTYPLSLIVKSAASLSSLHAIFLAPNRTSTSVPLTQPHQQTAQL
jgi:hypothetical protein